MQKRYSVYFGQNIKLIPKGERLPSGKLAYTDTAIINSIEGVLTFDTEEQAETFADYLTPILGAYVIPELYTGVIIWNNTEIDKFCADIKAHN